MHILVAWRTIFQIWFYSNDCVRISYLKHYDLVSFAYFSRPIARSESTSLDPDLAQSPKVMNLDRRYRLRGWDHDCKYRLDGRYEV